MVARVSCGGSQRRSDFSAARDRRPGWLVADVFPAPETLYGAPPPEKRAAEQAPAAHRRIVASATQVPLATGNVPCSIFEKTPSPGAPLRNRTVDLLLTMNHRAVTQPLVSHDDQAERERTPALASP